MNTLLTSLCWPVATVRTQSPRARGAESPGSPETLNVLQIEKSAPSELSALHQAPSQPIPIPIKNVSKFSDSDVSSIRESFEALIPEGASPCIVDKGASRFDSAFQTVINDTGFQSIFETLNLFQSITTKPHDQNRAEALRFRMVTMWMNSDRPPNSIQDIKDNKVFLTTTHKETRKAWFVQPNGQAVLRQKAYRVLENSEGDRVVVLNGSKQGEEIGAGVKGRIRFAEVLGGSEPKRMAIKKVHLMRSPGGDCTEMYETYREWYMARKMSAATDGKVLKPGPLFMYDTADWKDSPSSQTSGEAGVVMVYTMPLVHSISEKLLGKVTQKERFKMLHDTCIALKACHDAGFVHGDAKMANIGKKEGSYVLLDTGFSSRKVKYELLKLLYQRFHLDIDCYGGSHPSEHAMSVRSTYNFRPENRNTYTGREDVYAVGQMACFVLDIENDFDYCRRVHPKELYFDFHSPEFNPSHGSYPRYRNVMEHNRMPKEDRLSDQEKQGLRALIDTILLRPETTINDVVNHPVFQKGTEPFSSLLPNKQTPQSSLHHPTV